MRIRSIKPEFYTSHDIASIKDWSHRLVFIGIWSYVDDNGVGRDDVNLITSELFPLEEDPVAARRHVAEALDTLADLGLLLRYRYEDRYFLAVSGWYRHQKIDRPKKGRYPLPTSDDVEIDTRYAQYLAKWASGTGDQGSGEQGNRVNSERAAEVDALFKTFWTVYPRKVNKPKSREAFEKALDRIEFEPLMEAVTKFANDPNLPSGDEKQFVPYASTWLNRDGWEEESLPPRRNSNSSIKKTATQRAQEYLQGQSIKPEHFSGYTTDPDWIIPQTPPSEFTIRNESLALPAIAATPIVNFA
ncbi:hypothetical protein [Rhodococcus sp. ACS1]|uniref:hypothetical protein n=1 Tax=Rhodococcus sp. ACS1 TaxID=2028570 RepID=UPI00117BC41E|nr:hypothetical protein [Rhodococcus sp. ACS1]